MKKSQVLYTLVKYDPGTNCEAFVRADFQGLTTLPTKAVAVGFAEAWVLSEKLQAAGGMVRQFNGPEKLFRETFKDECLQTEVRVN